MRSKTIAHRYTTQLAAVVARRKLISQGVSVSLIGYDTKNDRYAFDQYIDEEEDD